MYKTVFIYGAILALLVFVLKSIEYKFWIRDLSTETYIAFIAVAFTFLGIWVGHKLLRRKTPDAFIRNGEAISYLKISDREIEVLEQLAEGYTNQQVADRLFISVNTVKSHIKNMYEKLEVGSRTAAIYKAKSLKIIP
ncbi:MAG: response regulator transcription factor [Xanthomonadales bacterium]|nr:response regulator transcription factor [Xanthomonadales bacterium]